MESNKDNNNNNNIIENLNKTQSPQTSLTTTITTNQEEAIINNNESNNNNNYNNKQTNLSINIHLPVLDRTDSKLSLNSTRELQPQQQPSQQKEKQTRKRDDDKKKQPKKLELPLIRESKMMPIIKENLSSTDMNSVTVDMKSKKPRQKQNRTAPPLLNKDLKSAPSYFCGVGISNGYLAMKVNPTTLQDFAYLNRNKLVNRRLSLRKQMTSSCLKGISILPQEFEALKTIDAEFALGNPNGFNNSDQDNSDTLSIENLETHREDPSTVDPSEIIAQNDSKVLETSANIDSEMAMKAGANSFENINASLNQEKQPRLIKSSSIVVLEKNSARNDQKHEDVSPVSYHVPRRPPHQKNSPMYTIGKRCFNEKNGGGRTSWEKEWYNSNNPFTIKSDFKRDSTWPTPVNYNIKSTIGAESSSSIYYQYPSVKINQHNNTPLSGRASNNNNPSSDGVCSCHMVLSREDLIEMELRKSNTLITTSQTDMNTVKKEYLDLNVEHSSNFVSNRAPKITFQFRNKGTQLWPNVEKTPGPGAYDHNKFSAVNKNRPKFSVGHARLYYNSNYNVGPFAAL